jgi:hypothetical protein
MLAESWQKEKFSKALTLAIATEGGFTIGEWNVDKDGVDVTLRSNALMVDIQLKCTQSPRTTRDGYSYDLDVKTYDKLSDPERSAPAYLVLVIVPTDLSNWVTHYSHETLLACHAYWATFELEKIARPNKVTTAVPLPREQRLNVAVLDEMFKVSRRHALYGTLGGEAA